MTFKMFNWINERLKAQHVLAFYLNTSKKYFKEEFDRPSLISWIDSDRDIVDLESEIRANINRYRPGYYNFYIFDKTTEEKFVIYDADKYNEENENGN